MHLHVIKNYAFDSEVLNILWDSYTNVQEWFSTIKPKIIIFILVTWYVAH